MARELTIQIRLTKEEHDRIAAQAGREGLGVGTYLRALALRNALESSDTPRGKAFAALRRSQDQSKARGLHKLRPKQIEQEIKAARRARGRRG